MNRESAFVNREDVCRDTNYRSLTISFTFHSCHGGFRQDEWLSCLLLTLRLCRVIRRDFKGTNTTLPAQVAIYKASVSDLGGCGAFRGDNEDATAHLGHLFLHTAEKRQMFRAAQLSHTAQAQA